jgi:hypothetical protein
LTCWQQYNHYNNDCHWFEWLRCLRIAGCGITRKLVFWVWPPLRMWECLCIYILYFLCGGTLPTLLSGSIIFRCVRKIVKSDY